MCWGGAWSGHGAIVTRPRAAVEGGASSVEQSACCPPTLVRCGGPHPTAPAFGGRAVLRPPGSGFAVGAATSPATLGIAPVRPDVRARRRAQAWSAGEAGRFGRWDTGGPAGGCDSEPGRPSQRGVSAALRPEPRAAGPEPAAGRPRRLHWTLRAPRRSSAPRATSAACPGEQCC